MLRLHATSGQHVYELFIIMEEKEETFVKQTFTKEKITEFILNELLGKFVGFMVGLWTTSWFSYTVYEKKGLSNLFGLMPRKKVVVNTTPEWLQWIICAAMGFIVLELFRYFFKKKIYLKVWEFFRNKEYQQWSTHFAKK